MHTKIQNLIEKIKAHSTINYDLAKSQYELLKNTNATNSDYEDFLQDLQQALSVFEG